MIDRFTREYLDYHQISAGRQAESIRVLRQFEERLPGALTEATGSDFADFLGYLLESGLHVNTVRKKANMVRSFFGWAFARGHMDADQYLQLKRVEDPRGSSGRSTPKPYTRTQVRAFWAELDDKYPLMGEVRYKRMVGRWLQGRSRFGRLYRHGMHLQIEAIVTLALHCGLRRQEIFQLTPDELHYDNAFIVVRGKADPHTGKVKVREVPVTDAVRVAIKRWLDHRALLRVGHDSTWISLWADAAGKPMWRTRFDHILPDTIGTGWELHRFRHTCATERLRSGASLEVVSKLMGHATLQQTMAYAEIAKHDVAKGLTAGGERFERAVGRRAA